MRPPQLLSFVLALFVGGALAPPARAATQRPVDIPERARGAEAVVVGRVVAVRTALERNAWGDELIVSHATVEVEETLKGRQGVRFHDVAVEGGTHGGYTLRVSDMPRLAAGERGVFFLSRDAKGAQVPHLRGQGILLLDGSNRVRGSSLSLDMIRHMARGATQ